MIKKEFRLNYDWAEKLHATIIWALILDKHLESQIFYIYIQQLVFVIQMRHIL